MNNGLSSLTVVIATLGGNCLRVTIERLNAGSVIPNEILICIPASDSHKVCNLHLSNARVLPTEVKGQVAQRAAGFRNASCDYVMQLDDDMLVDEHCVQYLLETLNKHGPRVAVAPSLFWTSTGESFYKSPANKTLLKWYYWLLNGSYGYQPGKITEAGTNVGIDPAGADQEIFAVDWVAGGCVMHRRENLILENFYPFAGKAYCEDIIHSHYLKSRGIELIVSAKATCWVECSPLWDHSWSAFLRGLAFDFKARQFFVRLTSRSQWRMGIFYLISLLRYGYVRLFKRMF